MRTCRRQCRSDSKEGSKKGRKAGGKSFTLQGSSKESCVAIGSCSRQSPLEGEQSLTGVPLPEHLYHTQSLAGSSAGSMASRLWWVSESSTWRWSSTLPPAVTDRGGGGGVTIACFVLINLLSGTNCRRSYLSVLPASYWWCVASLFQPPKVSSATKCQIAWVSRRWPPPV